jgi:hypothetical protein
MYHIADNPGAHPVGVWSGQQYCLPDQHSQSCGLSILTLWAGVPRVLNLATCLAELACQVGICQRVTFFQRGLGLQLVLLVQAAGLAHGFSTVSTCTNIHTIPQTDSICMGSGGFDGEPASSGCLR